MDVSSCGSNKYRKDFGRNDGYGSPRMLLCQEYIEGLVADGSCKGTEYFM